MAASELQTLAAPGAPPASSAPTCIVQAAASRDQEHRDFSITTPPSPSCPAACSSPSSSSFPASTCACDDETASESATEPLTPVSGRPSHDFHHPAATGHIAVPGLRVPELLDDDDAQLAAVGKQPQQCPSFHLPAVIPFNPLWVSAPLHSPAAPLADRAQLHLRRAVSSTEAAPAALPASGPAPARQTLHVPQLAPVPSLPLRASRSTKSLTTPTTTSSTNASTCSTSSAAATTTGTALSSFLRRRPKTSAGSPSSLHPPLLPPPTLRHVSSSSSSTSSSASTSPKTPRLRRVMSFFKRSNSNMGEMPSRPLIRPLTSSKDAAKLNGGSTDTSVPKHSRRFSFHRSAGTTRSNSPPSPNDTPLQMTPSVSSKSSKRVSMPADDDFYESQRKGRAHTGFSLRGRVVGFASSHVSAPKIEMPRPRARSVERQKAPKQGAEPEQEPTGLVRHPWAIAPAEGTGMKARRLSLSLPDDFTVDIAELSREFEYQHKILGRHRKHVGKGATSKVTLMVRKGCPTEIYAVKEFRSKSNSESTQDYENKIKSEFSIAKSLHHPNIVETIRLCTDHGRWNHVMEYASEGDLFSLVSKKYLKDESRESDRLCLFKQLCQGVNYLHSHGIAHRDIKLENLLITKDSKLKITDFGVSEVFTGVHPGLREAGGQCGVNMGEIRHCQPGICGSLPYIAPEVLAKKSDYDPRPLDVWSSAVVMIYLTFNACLWDKAETPNTATYDKLVSGWAGLDRKKAENPNFEATYPSVPAFELFVKPVALRRLLLTMLHPDPEKRMTMAEVVSSRWMKGVECCQPESYEDPTMTIDASKKGGMKNGHGSKIFCHNHLPPQATNHGLPPMPGKPGY
ncbi:protein-serine/threonine kinase [Microdochium nivale]|nr:protein-serine/threonine kinase [Microdochium nivale]